MSASTWWPPVLPAGAPAGLPAPPTQQSCCCSCAGGIAITSFNFGPLITGLYCFGLFLGTIYSVPPLRLKRSAIAAFLIIATGRPPASTASQPARCLRDSGRPTLCAARADGLTGWRRSLRARGAQRRPGLPCARAPGLHRPSPPPPPRRPSFTVLQCAASCSTLASTTPPAPRWACPLPGTPPSRERPRARPHRKGLVNAVPAHGCTCWVARCPQGR